jgi:hypothetical protein
MALFCAHEHSFFQGPPAQTVNLNCIELGLKLEKKNQQRVPPAGLETGAQHIIKKIDRNLNRSETVLTVATHTSNGRKFDRAAYNCDRVWHNFLGFAVLSLHISKQISPCIQSAKYRSCTQVRARNKEVRAFQLDAGCLQGR